MKRTGISAAALASFFIFVLVAQHQSYKGFQEREIKSLSAREIQQLLSGHGMGMALAAELNDYPGPRHVLELSEDLGLSGEQKEQVRAIFRIMESEAVQLGKKLVTRESELSQLFASKTVAETSLTEKLNEIAAIQASLRYVHLVAHLHTRRALSAAQTEKYATLRGYRAH